MKTFSQYLNEDLKKGDRVVATRNSYGGTRTKVMKGEKGSYMGSGQGTSGKVHHILWDGHRAQIPSDISTLHGHTHNEFKKLKRESKLGEP